MLYLQKNIKGVTLSIWKIEETKDELLSMLAHSLEIEEILQLKLESRIIEKLAIRVLLKHILGEEKKIVYHVSGRPYLVDKSYEIGISHTISYVAIALHPSTRIGLDIEQYSEKISRVSSRIISEDEYIDSKQAQTHRLLHWSAKEAIFKVLDMEGVNFIDHLQVIPFTPQKEGFFEARETKTSSKHCFNEVYYKVENDFVLVLLTLPK